MTTVTFDRTGNTYSVIADGHAGDKLVCCAISTIMYTLMGAVHNHGVDWIHRDMNPGDVLLSFTSTDMFVEEDIFMAMIGLKQLEITYPNHIHVVGGI